MSDPVEIWFRDGESGESVCLYSRMGFLSAEDALFLAMMDGDLTRLDEFAVWTLKKFWMLTGDEEPTNYGITSMAGRCMEQYHLDFKQKTIKYVIMDYVADPTEQMTIKKLWTFEDFFNTHLTTAIDRLPPTLPLIF